MSAVNSGWKEWCLGLQTQKRKASRTWGARQSTSAGSCTPDFASIRSFRSQPATAARSGCLAPGPNTCNTRMTIGGTRTRDTAIQSNGLVGTRYKRRDETRWKLALKWRTVDGNHKITVRKKLTQSTRWPDRPNTDIKLHRSLKTVRVMKNKGTRHEIDIEASPATLVLWYSTPNPSLRIRGRKTWGN